MDESRIAFYWFSLNKNKKYIQPYDEMKKNYFYL